MRKLGVWTSAAATVRNEPIEVVSVARKNKRLQICETVPLNVHAQYDRPRGRMTPLQFANPDVSPVFRLMEPGSRVKASPEVRPVGPGSV
nr:hypothetical protein [Bradyrhizobium liaoningense]